MVTLLVALLADVPYLGARVGDRSFFFDDLSPTGLSGTMLEADLGVRLHGRYHLYGFLERGLYDERSDRIAPGPFATSTAAGLGFAGSVAPDSRWDFVFDLAIGYRWLRVPFDSGDPRRPFGVDRFSGVEPLRVRLGPSLRPEPRLMLDLLFGAALGRFHGSGSTHVETCSITASCKDSFLEDSDTQSATYFTLDATFGIHTWL
ncbi:MAG: hypothetical protein ACXVEE_34235 [Polyangiales bacterium]